MFPMRNANRQVLLDEMLDAALLALSQLQVWVASSQQGQQLGPMWVDMGSAQPLLPLAVSLCY